MEWGRPHLRPLVYHDRQGFQHACRQSSRLASCSGRHHQRWLSPGTSSGALPLSTICANLLASAVQVVALLLQIVFAWKLEMGPNARMSLLDRQIPFQGLRYPESVYFPRTCAMRHKRMEGVNIARMIARVRTKTASRCPIVSLS